MLPAFSAIAGICSYVVYCIVYLRNPEAPGPVAHLTFFLAFLLNGIASWLGARQKPGFDVGSYSYDGRRNGMLLGFLVFIWATVNLALFWLAMQIVEKLAIQGPGVGFIVFAGSFTVVTPLTLGCVLRAYSARRIRNG